jgi:branched-chain amino acid transport system ATP-binding protein
MKQGSILSIEGLKKHFGGVVATDNVTLDVAAGDLQCIIGPNGAGKSTFFVDLPGICGERFRFYAARPSN